MAFGIGKVFYSRNISYKYRLDIKIEYIKIKDCGYIDGERDQNKYFKKYYQLFMSKN